MNNTEYSFGFYNNIFNTMVDNIKSSFKNLYVEDYRFYCSGEYIFSYNKLMNYTARKLLLKDKGDNNDRIIDIRLYLDDKSIEVIFDRKYSVKEVIQEGEKNE